MGKEVSKGTLAKADIKTLIISKQKPDSYSNPASVLKVTLQTAVRSTCNIDIERGLEFCQLPSPDCTQIFYRGDSLNLG